MTREIDVDALRDWLDAGTPVTVLDVRSGEDRAQWSIPGSLHADAYDALKAGRAGPLADLALPADRPVVTVCNAGRMSGAAAALLAARGFDARSLRGGMKAWSLAWNTAEVPVASPAVRVIQVRRTGKGCLSYVVGSQGEAAVIDPSVAPGVYLDLARRHGWVIRYVLDTHVHADHLSRAGELARSSGAVLMLPPQDRVAFAFQPMADGAAVHVGAATLRAVRTPGHTPESTCYLVDDAAVLTGDTLFADGVGRPDLHADPAAARVRAAALFASLDRLRWLSPDIVVLPGHASEPTAFDGRPVAARMADIREWLSRWLASEAAFVERVTSNLPPAPANFARIVDLNQRGEQPDVDLTELEAGANRCAVQ